MDKEIDHPWIESEPNGTDIEFLTDVLAMLIMLTVAFLGGITYGVAM